MCLRRVLILPRTICSTQRVNYGQSERGESRRSSNNDPLFPRPLWISRSRESFARTCPEGTDPQRVTVRRSIPTEFILHTTFPSLDFSIDLLLWKFGCIFCLFLIDRVILPSSSSFLFVGVFVENFGIKSSDVVILVMFC